MDDKKIYAYALKLLTGRNYFEEELSSVLLKKYPDGDVAGVLERIRFDGYLNDERTLKSYISYKIREGYGPYWIKEKLYSKGVRVSVEEIETVCETEEIDASALIKSLAEKYARTRKKVDNEAGARSCVRYLAARGFTLTDAINISKEVYKK